MDMNATALECNFVSFDTTEAQFMQSIEVITAGLTNDSLPSFNISTETGILVDSRDSTKWLQLFFQLKDFVQMKLLT